jgi:hypothetical protein
MNVSAQIARHFSAVHFGGNWTSVNLRDSLKDLTWQQAATPVYSLNSIASLVFHMNYYVSAVLKVMQGETLNASDRLSFDCPPVQSQEEWESLCSKIFTDAQNFAALLEQLPDSQLEQIFMDEKYGNWYRNMHGIVEHVHYHLGQIVIIKKILLQAEEKG